MTSPNLTTRSQDEIYYGNPTGRIVYYTEARWTEGQARGLSSVLGRGYTEEASKRDWARRAREDGHDI